MSSQLIPMLLSTSVLVAFLLLLGALAVLTFIDLPRVQNWRRRHILARIRGTRLQRLLESLGLDLEAYVAAQPPADLWRQMARCERCTAAAICDRETTRRSKHYVFCPNAAAIRAVQRSGSPRERLWG